MLKLFYLLSSIFSLLNAAWMLGLPFSWYTSFPAAIPDTGPFNAHFVRDIGVAYGCTALGFGWCALDPRRGRPVHLGLTIFFTGHALIHLFEILSGHLPHAHWLIDAPMVFLPALILIVLAVPAVRNRVGG
jgi:hypothetical protein